MTPIKVEYELTDADYQELSGVPLENSRRRTKVLKACVMIGMGLLAVSMFSSPGGLASAPRLVVSVGLLLVVFPIYFWVVQWSRPSFHGPTPGKPWSCTFSQTAMQWSSSEFQGALLMSSFLRWRETPTVIFLDQRGSAPQMIPKRAFDEAQLASFRALLQEAIGPVEQKRSAPQASPHGWESFGSDRGSADGEALDISFQLSAEETAEFQRIYGARVPSLPVHRVVTFATGYWLLMLLGVLGNKGPPTEHLGTPLQIVLFVLLMGVLAYSYFSSRRNLLKTNGLIDAALEYKLSPGRVTWRGPGGQMSETIDHQHFWQETDTIILLFNPCVSAHIFPKRALTAEQLQALRSILEVNTHALR